jgi:hypothetical protein
MTLSELIEQLIEMQSEYGDDIEVKMDVDVIHEYDIDWVCYTTHPKDDSIKPYITLRKLI